MSSRFFSEEWYYIKKEQTARKLGLAPPPEPPAIPDRICNQTTAEKFEYSPLGTRSLRLLILLPGTRQEDICCGLYEAHLDDSANSYEALSYVWGDSAKKTPIQVNSQTLMVGINLRTALLNLRDLQNSRILWIDAICINQEDLDERSVQVAIMGDIYRQARRTVIWLGDYMDNSLGSTKQAFALIKDLADDAVSLGQVERSTIKKPGRPEVMMHLSNFPTSKIGRSTVTSKLLETYKFDSSVQHILESEWWYRAWTIQEILLASDAVVVVGPHSIDWDVFCIGGNHGVNIGLWITVAFGVMHYSVITPYLSLQAMEMVCHTHNSEENIARVMLELLIRCQFREATNPRDKIYSLLGLLTYLKTDGGRLGASEKQRAATTSMPLGIWPDYKMPLRTLYSYIARQIITETGTLDIVGACVASSAKIVMTNLQASPSTAGPACDRSPALDGPLPRWVPDWNMTDPAVIPLLHNAFGQPRATHATSHSITEPKFLDIDASGIPTTLLLHAHEVATLAELANPLTQISLASRTKMDKATSPKTPRPGEKTIFQRLEKLGEAFRGLQSIYNLLLGIVPHLAIFAEWEQFTQKTPLTNPCRPNPKEEEEPQDALATYWQTLATGTYPDAAETSVLAPGRGRKIAAQKLFYTWRASLEPIRNMHRWRIESALRPVAFVGYVRKTWNMYSEFIPLLEGSYGRRLARAANGYLCLVPSSAKEGDVIILARGGRVPLVVRSPGEGAEPGYWEFVGEAYIHGIMNGEAWDDTRCREFKIR